MSSPYSRFQGSQLILRDELAMDRTLLAIERTHLAYVRTALALLLTGLGFVHFSHATWFASLGGVCAVAGVAVFARGYVRYRRMLAMLAGLRRQAEASGPAVPPPGDV